MVLHLDILYECREIKITNSYTGLHNNIYYEHEIAISKNYSQQYFPNLDTIKIKVQQQSFELLAMINSGFELQNNH